VPNGDFESSGYDVGTPPSNSDFESGDLTSWTASGAASVQPDGPTGSYARLTNGSSITSSPFDVPANAQTFTIDIGFFSSNSCIGVDVLSGTTFGTVTQLPADCGASGWHSKSVNATQWAGQTIEVRLRAAGNPGVDNAAVMRVVLDQWDVSGSVTWIPEQRFDGPSGAYGRVPNSVKPATAPFQLPAGPVALTYNRRVSVNSGYNLYVHCGPTFGVCARVVTNDSASAGQWIAKTVDLSQWQGQVVFLEFYNAGTFDLDTLELVVP
jgi:hypothetical protein